MAAENPIVAFRVARGWDQAQAGLVLGVSKAMMSAVEHGYPIRLSGAIAKGITRIGGDAEAIAKAYTAWRAEVAAELMASGQARANG